MIMTNVTTKLILKLYTTMLIYLGSSLYYQTKYLHFMRPPVGVPGKDVFYVPNYCDKCSRHFFIDAEMEMHKKIC